MEHQEKSMQTLTAEYVLSLEAGRAMDALVAQHVMGDAMLGRDFPFAPSTREADAMTVVHHLAPKVTHFANGDGWFVLSFADDDDYSHPAECSPAGERPENGRVWTAHYHVRIIGADSECPAHWNHGDTFCAIGETPAIAICRASLLAMIPPAAASPDRVPPAQEEGEG